MTNRLCYVCEGGDCTEKGSGDIHDKLKDLVKEQEVEIQDVRLALVVDSYMEHLRHLENLDIEVAGDYLVVAATLLAIKSRSLLPREEVELEKLIWNSAFGLMCQAHGRPVGAIRIQRPAAAPPSHTARRLSKASSRLPVARRSSSPRARLP